MKYDPRHAAARIVRSLPRWAKITAPAVTVLALAGGGAAYAAGAGAATNACGSQCIDISFLSSGHHWLLNDSKGRTSVNAVVSQQLGSNGGNQGRNEDFVAHEEGAVDGTYCADGTTPASDPLFTANQCTLINNAGLGSAEAFQVEYVPFGGEASGMCQGTWDGTNPLPSDSNWLARLQPCGVNANTVVIVTNHLPAGHTSSAGSVWAISGASNNFSNPEVLGNNGQQQWQNLTWQPIHLNGGVGEVNQEIRVTPGAY
jgi:hypothetical protein